MKRLISAFMLIAYSAVLTRVMVFKDVPMVRVGSMMFNFGGSQTGPANLIPFKTILVYLLGQKGLLIGAINLLGNIILLVPAGILIPLIFRNLTWKKMLIPAGAAGFAIEGMQVVLRVGIFDIDDVILNGLGVMTGYWLFIILSKKLGSMSIENLKVAVGIAVIVVGLSWLYIASAYQKGQLFLSFEPAVVKIHADQAAAGMPQKGDPCGGTGGTGKIVAFGNHTVTIKRGDGVETVIQLTERTEIRNSAGAVLESQLKIGDGITVVTDNSETAVLILVCNT